MEAVAVDASSDLNTVLEAWHAATLRLERTHETLRGEVHRLRTELEAKNRQLARKDRLADLGQMASHVAHEVRNNLVPVSLYLSLLRRRLGGEQTCLEVVEKIDASFVALDVMVNDLLHFTKDREPHLAEVALHDLVDGLLDGIRPQLDAHDIAAENRVPPEARIAADTEMIRRAILNLLLNAIDAMQAGGRLSISLRPSGNDVRVEVADTGPGLSIEVQRQALEPFFSTKSTGTGLGLAIVERVAEAHGGAVTLQNRTDGGALVSILLPRQPGPEKE